MKNLVKNKKLSKCLETLFSNIFSSENNIDQFWLSLFAKTSNQELLTKNIFNTCINEKNTHIYLVSAVEEKESDLKAKK